MSVQVELSVEEITRIRELTHAMDDSQAVAQAARDFLRREFAKELKQASGNVDFALDWKQLEAAELLQPLPTD